MYVQSDGPEQPDIEGDANTADWTLAKSSEKHVRCFLLPTLLSTDLRLTGRWDYLTDCWKSGALPDAPIPPLHFLSVPDKTVWKMLTAALDAIPRHGSSWQGWSSSTNFRFFLEWMLYGLHHPGQPEPPMEPVGCEGASDRLHEVFDLALLMQHPYDYFGELLSQNAYGKKQGFFPTPHHVCEMMVRMTMGFEERDTRILTVCDPCVGTGRLLLHASNFSMRLYGMDIDPLLCQATLVNGYLYAPWLVRPLPFLDGVQYNTEHSAALSEMMAEQAQPHQKAALADTEHDATEQWRFEPVKKRRHKDDSGETRQGALF